MEQEKYFYLCNRKKCEICQEFCKHTTDELFAKNPKEQRVFVPFRDGSMWEIDRKECKE